MVNYHRIKINAGNPMKIHNPTRYPLLGSGLQGAVFKLSSKRCIKFYLKKEHFIAEKKSLAKLQGSPYFPKMYKARKRYIIMDYFHAPNLREYLKAKGRLPRSVTKQLVNMLAEMKRLKLTRLDAMMRHIFITGDQRLKVIDHTNSFRTKRPYPKLLLKDFERLGCKEEFLRQVKAIDRPLYESWRKYL